jgi:hypothetical protein
VIPTARYHDGMLMMSVSRECTRNRRSSEERVKNRGWAVVGQQASASTSKLYRNKFARWLFMVAEFFGGAGLSHAASGALKITPTHHSDLVFRISGEDGTGRQRLSEPGEAERSLTNSGGAVGWMDLSEGEVKSNSADHAAAEQRLEILDVENWSREIP